MKNNPIKNKDGMVIFEFMIVIFIAMLTVGMLIEFGFILKSEAILVGITKNAARSIQVKGEITKAEANEIINKLNGYKIRNAKITLHVYNYGNANTFTTYQYGAGVGNPAKVPVRFRQSFKLYIKGDHSLNFLALTGLRMTAPVVFTESGKGERVDFIN